MPPRLALHISCLFWSSRRFGLSGGSCCFDRSYLELQFFLSASSGQTDDRRSPELDHLLRDSDASERLAPTRRAFEAQSGNDHLDGEPGAEESDGGSVGA